MTSLVTPLTRGMKLAGLPVCQQQAVTGAIPAMVSGLSCNCKRQQQVKNNQCMITPICADRLARTLVQASDEQAGNRCTTAACALLDLDCSGRLPKGCEGFQ